MSLPLHSLPVLQNWDCHGCTHCCRAYVVTVTPEEKQRIESQGWEKDPEIGDLPLFRRRGWWWNRRYRLTDRNDGSCVFLNADGRCRIHEKFGSAAKPLACRLFPFVLVPGAREWHVGLRFACPSVAGNEGRPLHEHQGALLEYATALEKRSGMDGREPASPSLQAGQNVGWPDTLRFVKNLAALMSNHANPVELRLRQCLALARHCRKARFDQIKESRLGELLHLLRVAVEAETPRDPSGLPPPGWVGRVLFRQTAALYIRIDHGAYRGPATGSRVRLTAATWRFARGQGPVPRTDAHLPESTFEQAEQPRGPMPRAAEEMLERYYLVKLASLQFFGPANHGLPLWDGLDALALTFPVICWVARLFADVPREQAVARAVSIVDDHFGFNPLLGSRRQRFALSLLGRSDELDRLITWYSR